MALSLREPSGRPLLDVGKDAVTTLEQTSRGGSQLGALHPAVSRVRHPHHQLGALQAGENIVLVCRVTKHLRASSELLNPGWAASAEPHLYTVVSVHHA